MQGYSVLTLVIYALATARLTGIATGLDEITRPYMRVKFADWVNPQELESGWRHLVTYLATCMWCASIYIGILLMAPIALWHGTEPWALIPALGLTFSWVSGATSEWGR